MPPDPVPPSGVLARVANGWHTVKRVTEENVNFFRLHVAAFVFVPLILGSIMYAANGRFTIGYLDTLFIAYSAMAGCGLSTVNLSTLTAFQQSVLFVLMLAGHYGVVSYLMVLARKRYFQTRCARFAKVYGHKSRSVAQVGRDLVSRFSPTSTPVVAEHPEFIVPEVSTATESSRTRRVRALSTGAQPLSRSFTLSFLPRRQPVNAVSEKPQLPRQVLHLRQEEAPGAAPELPMTPIHSSPAGVLFGSPMHSDDPSAARVQFLDSPMLERTHSHVSSLRSPVGGQFPMITSSPRSINSRLPGDDILSIRSGSGLRRRPTAFTRPTPPVRGATILSTPTTQTHARHHEHGGIPTISLITSGLSSVAKKAAPGVYKTLERKLTTNVTPRIIVAPTLKSAQPAPKVEGSEDSNWADEVGEALEEAIDVMKSKVERWVTFDGLKVFRNSEFGMEDLTDEQFEEIGGIEYKALRLLSYIVPLYVIGVQLFCFILIAPWLASTSKYDPVFDAQPRMIDKAWFSAFQVVGAFTGGGFSLSDLSMVPFQGATLMIWSLIFGILAGNHAFPIFLRLTIWVCTKFCTEGSPTDRALHFLLDHPRRCFIYLFPCQQTWFLVVVLVFFSILEWFAFLVLNIGLDITESIALPRRVLLGLFQGIAARASGFAIISVGGLAPAVIFLYIVMMYIAVFPLAMAIRGTNVYEERSLGIYQPQEAEEPQLDGETKSREAVSKYLGWHLKKQLAFDLWWLVLGIFLVCIIERKMLMDDELAPWFNLFRVVFELVSAYGGVGLSLGIPTENFSFCGAFKPLSKIVIIFVMIRGRHRGLPMAVDRAVMLPEEFSVKPVHELHPSGERSRAHTLP